MCRFRRVVMLVVLSVLATGSFGVAASDDRVIVALGDSLTAGFGVTPDEAYPARLEARLRREGYAYRVVNAGVSGDTSAGARRRLDWALRTKPEIVIVALGANDGLRGQRVSTLRDNLIQIITRSQAAGARVLLVGMRLPPNYGEEYARDFAAAFSAVARRTKAGLMPFLLDGVAAVADLNQADGIHPNARGHAVITERLWPYLRPLLKSTPGRSSLAPGTEVIAAARDSPPCHLVGEGLGGPLR